MLFSHCTPRRERAREVPGPFLNHESGWSRLETSAVDDCLRRIKDTSGGLKELKEGCLQTLEYDRSKLLENDDDDPQPDCSPQSHER